MKKITILTIIIACFLSFASLGCSHHDPCGVDIDQLTETATDTSNDPHISGAPTHDNRYFDPHICGS